MTRVKSELAVIIKAKNLCSYIFTITEKSPKKYRFTFVNRMQNLCLDIIEDLYRANDTYVIKGDQLAIKQRLDYQHHALTSLRLLSYISMLASDSKCILFKQFEVISKQIDECEILLGAWINSDRKRYGA